MSWKRYAGLSLLAGIVLPTALAQTPDTPLPERTKSSVRRNRSAVGTPPLRTSGTSAGASTGIPGSTVPGTRPTRGTTPTNRREPCWQVAGVSKAAMEQRHIIAQQTRQEVEAVCANAALSAAQKQERIRALHQQERQQVDALISPQQREAMRACQQQRGGGTHLGGGHLGGGHGGPCGTLPGVAHRMNESEPEEATPKD